jgi:ribosomal protein L24
VGFEEQITFKALARAIHPDRPEIIANAVIAHPGLPGRVFIETSSAVDAQNFATSIAELNPRVIRLVPHEDIPSILHVKSPFCFDGKDWARISGTGKGWSLYKGDIGMIVPYEGRKTVIVIPRIKTSFSRDRHRPAQAPFPPYIARAIFGEYSINSNSSDGSFTFKGRRYTKEGFLYCALDEVDLRRPADDIPTQKELDIFKECSLMNEVTLSRIASRLEQLKITIGSRVAVVQGDFRGLFARVVDTAENEVTVIIDSLGHFQQMSISAVRTTYRIGDEVRICNGIHIGIVGWIVDIQEQTVTVVNTEKEMEVLHDRENINALQFTNIKLGCDSKDKRRVSQQTLHNHTEKTQTSKWFAHERPGSKQDIPRKEGGRDRRNTLQGLQRNN